MMITRTEPSIMFVRTDSHEVMQEQFDIPLSGADAGTLDGYQYARYMDLRAVLLKPFEEHSRPMAKGLGRG